MGDVLHVKCQRKGRCHAPSPRVLTELEVRQLLSSVWSDGTHNHLWSVDGNWYSGYPNGDEGILANSPTIEVDGGGSLSKLSTVAGTGPLLNLDATLTVAGTGAVDIGGDITFQEGANSGYVSTYYLYANGTTGNQANIVVVQHTGSTVDVIDGKDGYIGSDTGTAGSLNAQGNVCFRYGLVVGSGTNPSTATGYGGLSVDYPATVEAKESGILFGATSFVQGSGTIFAGNLNTGVGLVRDLGGQIAPGEGVDTQSLVVEGDLDLPNFGLHTRLSTTPDSLNHNTNALVVSGTVTLGYPNLFQGATIAMLVNQFTTDTGHVQTGDIYPLIVANYFIGDFDNCPLNTTLSSGATSNFYVNGTGATWELRLVHASLNGLRDYNVDLTGDNWAVVLYCTNGASGGYGGYGGGGGGQAMMVSRRSDSPSLEEEASTFASVARIASVESTVIENVGIRIDWSGENRGVEIQRKANDGSWLTVRVARGGSGAWLDTNVEEGIAYQYRVRGLDAGSDFELTSSVTY